ncbi:HAD-superfamily phosphatase, subfamily IIIC/FkbH-like domain-containing protein/amino acid adenylation domain-containing protein [Chitinophaga eiseniae]|uniref:HAD-superfamily phosphatase, subfamily IIIC/FkbH-like domain-containing protein/amino acid adenylation domain-containing protein n=1 Tax=Chitinophaga eiseniae TaxID=634771 RepID=A0A1T4U7A3_9BACT|nr:non-ribosomal peptide synthetase [Chitinophaga eiseniae]SKA48553.1 HAD-superfamily phosphatase, subfamily IIIC/FkbH-like domain-containing protein/amino acid adenylation domain-containing protein [Chitinophaga eiseniae]
MSRLEGYALSPQQKEAWLSIKEGCTGRVQAVFRCGTAPDWEKMCRAVKKVLEENAAYRLKFVQVPGESEPIQLRVEDDQVKFELIETEDMEQGASMIHGDSNGGPYPDEALLYVSLYRNPAGGNCRLVFSSSPLCADVWGVYVLAINVFAAYNNAAALPEPPIDYLQFAGWQNGLLESEDMAEGKRHWQSRTSHGNPMLPDILFAGKHHDRTADVRTLSCLPDNELVTALQQHASPESLMAACWYMVLWKLNNQANFLMGHVHHGRSFEQLYHLVGSFAKVLPLQLNINGHLPLSAVVRHYEQELSLADTHKEALKEDEHYHRFITDSLPCRFAYTDYNQLAAELPVHPASLLQARQLLQLQLEVSRIGDQYQMTLYYNSLSYTATDADYLFHAWQSVLQQVLTQGENIMAANIELLNNRYRTLQDLFSAPESIPPQATDIISLFRQQVIAHPQKMAVTDGERSLSYEALDRQSSLLAGYLLHKGYVTGHKHIGVIQREKAGMIISLLAVLKAGAAYVPIDPDDAVKRVQHILADAGVSCVLTDSSLAAVASGTTAALVALDLINPAEDAAAYIELPGRTPHTPAYVIYTSGTSGLPKGVVIPDSALVNYVTWLQLFAGVCAADSSLLLSSYAFDLGYTALWGSLLSGGALHLLFKAQVQDVEALAAYIAANGISFIKTTPSFFNVLIRAAGAGQLATSALRLVILGGESINTEDLQYLNTQVSPGIAVINHYGPTETTIGTVAYKVPLQALDAYKRRPVIGRPVSNNRVLILDTDGKPVAPGLPGEICIGGHGLAMGYFNRNDLTNEKFVEHTVAGGRIYLTGDAGAWLPDGTILFLGRKDEQVKIRGYRVEPGEVKQAVARYPGIQQVALTVKGEVYNRQLFAYVTAATSLDTDSIKTFLKEALPDYMVPAYIMQVQEIPLTVNGKIDYRALPDPAAVMPASAARPRNSREAGILDVWRQVLGNGNMGIDDNFFDLGGHSLKAIQVVNRLQKELKIKTSLKDIFDAPTVRAFHDATKEADEQTFKYIEAVPRRSHYGLSNSQKRIWFTSQRQGSRSVFNVPQLCLFKGELNTGWLKNAFIQLINRHEALRTVFRQVNGEVAQVILDPAEVNFSLQLLSAADKSEAAEIISREAIAPFDLENEIGLRAKLITLAPGEQLLMFTLHHIISDGWSREIIYRELLHFYEADYHNRPAAHTPLRIQYKDYVSWHEQVYQEQEPFWEAFFKAGIPDNNFPLDYSRPKTLTFEGNVCVQQINTDSLLQLKKVVNDHKLTLNSLLLSVYGLLLGEYCQLDEVMVGTIVSGRSHIDLEEIIGVFINYLPFKIKINSADDFVTYTTAVNQSLMAVYQHQEYPFDLMVEKFGGSIKPGRNPVFDTMMIFHEVGDRKHLQELPGNIKIEQYEENERQYLSKLDFKIDVVTGDDGISLRLEYNSNLFTAQTMQLLLERYTQLLLAVAARPSSGLEELRLIPAAERLQLSARQEKQAGASSNGLRIIASFTAEPLEEPLQWWQEVFEQEAHISFGNYHQVFQELMSATQQPLKGQTFILLNRFEDYVQGQEGSNAIATLDMVYDKMTQLLSDLAQSVPVVMVLLPPSEHTQQGSAVARYVSRLNENCSKVFKDRSNVYLCDLRDYAQLHPGLAMFDDLSYRQAYIPFTDEGFYFIAYNISRVLRAIKGHPCKVIALDCDNTLWKGICGEDNLDGIIIDQGHRALQQYFVQKHAEGFLLVLLSKNNEKDVWQVFEQHPDMVLKKEHFAGTRINWQDKPDNILSLAKELNLGTDSFAFIDDSPVECFRMMQERPEVLTLELPDVHHHFVPFFRQVVAFDKLRVSKEDAARNAMYKAEVQRSASLKDTGLTGLQEQLQLEMSVRPMVADELERVAQLTLRTNQFNLNGIRRSMPEISALLENKACTCYVVHVRDRFGDYGLTGVVISEQRSDELFLHNFLLSCRVLGRGVEQALLQVFKHLAQQCNVTGITAAFRQTIKNIPFSDFLAAAGWVNAGPHGDDVLYRLTLEQVPADNGNIAVYIGSDLPPKPGDSIAPSGREAAAPDFVFDHIGVAVTDMSVCAAWFEALGFQWGEEVFDPLQQCTLRMGTHPACYNIELVAGAADGAPVANMLQQRSFLPYHVCFRVRNHRHALDYLAAILPYNVVKSPQPAVLFNGLPVLFIYLEDVGLVELLEDPGMSTQSPLPGNLSPVIQLSSNNTEQTRKAFRLLGFEPDIISAHDSGLPAGALRMVWDTSLFDPAQWSGGAGEYMLFRPLADTQEQAAWIWRKNLCNEEQLLHKQVYRALEYANLAYLRETKQQKLQVLRVNEVLGTADDELAVSLLSLFRELLRNNKIGVNDDFFHSGGHSIKAVQLLSRIYAAFGVEISLARFFELATVKRLTEQIVQQRLTASWMQTAIAENDDRFDEVVI